MRAYLNIAAKNKIIPLDHRDQLLKIIYKWLRWNNDAPLPLFSFSRFEGGRNTMQGISFNDDSSFFFSTLDDSTVYKIAQEALSNPNLFNGLKVTNTKALEAPDLSKREVFYAASPLLLLKEVNPATEFIVYKDENANEYLKDHTLNKLSAANIHDETFDIYFDPNYAQAGTKKISYNDETLRASWCQIIIKGLPTTKDYLWHIGLGDKNNMGFGAIM